MQVDGNPVIVRRAERAPRVCFAILGVIFALHYVGRFVNELLLGWNPTVLVLVSPTFDHTLRVVSEMTLTSFMLVGVLRRILADPFWFYLGRVGPHGLLESNLRIYQALGRAIDKVEEKVESVNHAEGTVLFIHFWWAGMSSSYLAGRMGISLKKIIPINLVGTILHVYMFWRLGAKLEPYSVAVDWSSRVLTAGFIAITIWQFSKTRSAKE